MPVHWINTITDRLGGRIQQLDAALYLKQNGGEEVIIKSYAPKGLAVYAHTLQGLSPDTSIGAGREELARWHRRFQKLGVILKVYVSGRLIATLGGKKSKLNFLNALYVRLFKRR